jgi:hypothetical protein
MLDASATVGDVADRLRKPVEYLRAVLDALHVAQRRNPGAVLRIGLKGEGQYPNYRVDAPDGTLVAAFNGRTYNALTGKDSLAEENWSRAGSSLAEVQLALRESVRRHPAAA